MSEMSQTLLFLCQVSTDWYSVYRATPPVTPQRPHNSWDAWNFSLTEEFAVHYLSYLQPRLHGIWR